MQERRVMGMRGAGGHLLWYLLLPQGSRKQGHRLRMKNGRRYGRFRGQRRRQDRRGGVDELGKHSVTARCPATPLDVSRPKSKLNRRGRVDRRLATGGTDQAQPCWNRRWQILKYWAELVENKGGGGKSPELPWSWGVFIQATTTNPAVGVHKVESISLSPPSSIDILNRIAPCRGRLSCAL